MALNLYRRHNSERRCIGGHAPFTQTYESDELRPRWKKCACPIYASGKLGRNPKFRKNTKAIAWDEAKRIRDAWERGEEKPEPPAPAPAPGSGIERVPIERAVERYLENRKARAPRPATLKKYQTFTNQLRAFAQTKGYVMLDQFTALDLDAFYSSWKDGPRSKGKKLERMRGFFRFSVKRRMIAENPSEDLEPPIGYSKIRHKSPFTDEELDRIFDAVSRWQDSEWHDGRGHQGVCTRDQIVAFTMLLVETGLRISDAATFHVSDRVNPLTGECFLFMHKTGKPLYAWINPDLRARLHRLTATHGPAPFDTPSKELNQKTDAWRERLRRVFFEAGPFDEHPTPHRFRHTFTRLQLQRGVPVDDVAELIGDTPEIVRKYYARWIPERQERLTAIQQAAYESARKTKWHPRAQVVKMPAPKRA